MSQLFWYTARAGGIVAWALLGASVVWGLWLSGRVRPMGARPAWILDLHRFLGGLATIFVGVHVASILLDTYTDFGLTDVLVPFASSWHPARGRLGSGRAVRAPRGRADVAGPAPVAAAAVAHAPRGVAPALRPRDDPLRPAGTDASNVLSLAAIGVVSSAIVLLFVRRMQEVRARGGGLIPASPSPTTDPAPSARCGPVSEPWRVPLASTEDRLARLAARRSGASART